MYTKDNQNTEVRWGPPGGGYGLDTLGEDSPPSSRGFSVQPGGQGRGPGMVAAALPGGDAADAHETGIKMPGVHLYMNYEMERQEAM